MTTTLLKDKDVLLPEYVLGAIKSLKWIESTDDSIKFHEDDFIIIHYGIRGSTSFTGPALIRYGSNTTNYQFFSPRLPNNELYLGDAGSGILEASSSVMKKVFEHKINPFRASAAELSTVLKKVHLLFSHYHYDHLHLGLPLTALAHLNTVKKEVIGADSPRSEFENAFRRPHFPRDFEEIESAYDIRELKDPETIVIIYLPNGEVLFYPLASFDKMISQKAPQISHEGETYSIDRCVVAKTYITHHSDLCLSYRFEIYNSSGALLSSFVFMTDHEIMEDDLTDPKFIKQCEGCTYLYIDGQYDKQNYIPSFGHGRIELIAEMAGKLRLPFICIGHHDPNRIDSQVDAMIENAREVYRKGGGLGKIAGASDRMMIFIPGASRKRHGVVFGRMDIQLAGEIRFDFEHTNDINAKYKPFDLTTVYHTIDETERE